MKIQKAKEIRNRKYEIGIVSFLFLISYFLFPAIGVFAQPSGGSNTAPAGGRGGSNTAPAKTFFLQNSLKVDSLGGLLSAFVQVFTYLVVMFAVLALVYVGLRYIMARGNSEEITKRTNQLLWIVVGVAIVIGARIIVAIVINTLGASNIVDPNVIQSANNALDGR